MTGTRRHVPGRVLAALVLGACLVVPAGAHAEGDQGVGPALASSSASPASSPSPDPVGDPRESTHDGGFNWVGSIIGVGLLGLAGWTMWRAARVRSRYERYDPRDLDPDMRHDDPDRP